MNYYLEPLRQYAVFAGRTARKPFWMFVLFNFLASVVVSIINTALILAHIPGILPILYSLAVLIPSLAIGVRRLHDTGRSGWWLLIGLVPIVGIIILIVFWAQPSTSATPAAA